MTTSNSHAIVLTVVLAVSLAVSGVVAADYDGDRPDLDIEQPTYIDDEVDVERTDNATVYHVSGPDHWIEFQNADYQNVTDVGVLDGPGSIEPDGGRERFYFDANGAEATTAIYFDVREDGATTRYVADIRVSDVDWHHMPADEYDEHQEELAAWESVKREAESAVPGEDPVEVIKSGLSKEAFFESPTAALRADMQGTLIMLFMTPGGLVIAGTFVGVVLIMLARAYRYKNRTQKQLAELEEMDREKDEAWLQKARKILQQCDLNEFYPDHIARALREYFGRNTWLAFKQYSLLRSPVSVKGTILQMMAQTGYVGYIRRDDAGTVLEARAVREPDESRDIPITNGGDGEFERVDLAHLSYDDDDDREIIDAIPFDDLDEDVFEANIDTTEVSFPIDNRDVSDAELLEELDPSFPGDFEDREELARVLGELMRFVATHDHTDDDGNVRREMDLLSFLMEMDTILHDEADFPTAYLYQKELLYIAERIDKGDRLDQRIDSLSLDGISNPSNISFEGTGGTYTGGE